MKKMLIISAMMVALSAAYSFAGNGQCGELYNVYKDCYHGGQSAKGPEGCARAGDILYDKLLDHTMNMNYSQYISGMCEAACNDGKQGKGLLSPKEFATKVCK